MLRFSPVSAASCVMPTLERGFSKLGIGELKDIWRNQLSILHLCQIGLRHLFRLTICQKSSSVAVFWRFKSGGLPCGLQHYDGAL
jgi:hypothetical protein